MSELLDRRGVAAGDICEPAISGGWGRDLSGPAGPTNRTHRPSDAFAFGQLRWTRVAAEVELPNQKSTRNTDLKFGGPQREQATHCVM